MFNKILSTVSMAAMSAMVLIGSGVAAKALTVTHVYANDGIPHVLTSSVSEMYIGANGDTLGHGGYHDPMAVGGTLLAGAAFSDVYIYNITDVPGQEIKWGGDVTYAQPTSIGIQNLTLTWDTGATMVITDAAGVDGPASNWAYTSFATGLHTLTVTGTLLSMGGAYSTTLNAVPLPPAALLFGTALFGIGALRRRKGKKAMDLAA